MHESGVKNNQNLQTEIIQNDSVWRFLKFVCNIKTKRLGERKIKMKNIIENSVDWRLKRGEKVSICCSSKETKAVQIAARNLADDLQKVLQARAVIKEEISAEDGCRIVIHTAGIGDGNEWLEKYLPQKEVQGTKTEFQKEGTLCMCRDGVLYLAGDACKFF